MIFVDAGSTYAKYFDNISGKRGIINIKDFKTFLAIHSVDVATGHSAKIFQPKIILNELVVLKEAVSLLGSKTFTVIDVGSRDIKLVKYQNGQFENCDWNTACGAMVGFTVDLIMKYFDVKTEELKFTEKTVDVTCGLLGITRFFDEVSKGGQINEGLSMLINGMAKFTYSFANKPEYLFLSGGMTENHIFTQYLKNKLGKNNFVSLGRFALIDGMQSYINNNKNKENIEKFLSL